MSWPGLAGLQRCLPIAGGLRASNVGLRPCFVVGVVLCGSGHRQESLCYLGLAVALSLAE
jgi:hypothetical protein